MTETRFTWRWLFVVGAIGLFVGLLMGLIGGWVLGPLANPSVDISSLSLSAQNDYIVLVANSYAYDSDLNRAKSRLEQLKDPNPLSRVEKLAKGLQARQDPAAANVAELAVALGSTDSSLQVRAATAAATLASTVPVTLADSAPGPTKFAQIEIPPSATPRPTQPPTNTAAATATIAPTTPAPTKASQSVALKSTPKPPATAVPVSNVPATIWLPPLASDWPTSVFFRAASVAPGQQYWHLVKALYCDRGDANSDRGDSRNGCPDMPGGFEGVATYVMLMNPDGSRAEADLNVRFDNGGGDKVGSDIVVPKDVGDQCNCNYSFESSNYLVQVQGASDAVGGMCLCSRTYGFQSHSHVRYFFWFQKTTR